MGQHGAQLGTRIAYLVGLLVLSWPIMLWTHELGHLFGGWISGGVLKDYDLRPWMLPYSMFEPDPRPLVTLWCGPICGIVLPLLAAAIVRQRWIWFVADFCVLANGLYMAGSWFSGEPYLDTTQLLSHGAYSVSIGCYCALTIGVGYWRFRKDCMAVFRLNDPNERLRVANTL